MSNNISYSKSFLLNTFYVCVNFCVTACWGIYREDMYQSYIYYRPSSSNVSFSEVASF